MSDYDIPRMQAWNLVMDERNRQDDLVASGKIACTLASRLASNYSKLAVLLEEVGEIAREMNDGDENNMRSEIVHVAACAVAWLESYATFAEAFIEPRPTICNACERIYPGTDQHALYNGYPKGWTCFCGGELRLLKTWQR